MSLTPEQITAQNFKDFYDGIKPYLNSYIPFQSHFNRGDLYSTDEKIIGQWIDGKPLYQKTIYIATLPYNAVLSVPLTDIPIEFVCNITGVAYSTGIFRPLPYVYSTTNLTHVGLTIGIWVENVNSIFNIKINSAGDRSDHSAYVTLQYTKTTDSVTNIGLDTDYSTDEKIVGTWIDGKPVYQKVITGLNISMSWNQSYNTVGTPVFPISRSDIDTIVSVSGITNTYNTPIPLVVDDSNNILSNTSMSIKTLIWQYTKTTA